MLPDAVADQMEFPSENKHAYTTPEYSMSLYSQVKELWTLHKS
jgi:hypothetical protein